MQKVSLKKKSEDSSKSPEVTTKALKKITV
jgi:hypothetical protein